MSDRPIIFSAPMVRALLDGRKTQTRRVLKWQPSIRPWLEEPPSGDGPTYLATFNGDEEVARATAPYAPGDRLYVREAFNAFQFSQDGDEAWPVQIPTLEECKEADELGHRYGAPQIVYRESDRARKWFADQKWRPSIHMPRWASRLTLTVTNVRVQRLQDITEEDAVAEGGDPVQARMYPELGTCRHWFQDLWNSLHCPDAWDANPWVVALTFTVHHGNIDTTQQEAKHG